MARYYRKKKTDTSLAVIVLVIIIGLGVAGIKILPDSNMVSLVLYGLGFLVVVFGVVLLWLIIQRDRKRIKALSLSNVDNMTHHHHSLNQR